MVRVLFKDEAGNKIVENSKGNVYLKNKQGKICTMGDFKSVVKENKLGNKIRFRGGDNLWIHDEFLK